MKTLNAICLTAMLLTFASCNNSSSDDKKPVAAAPAAPQEGQNSSGQSGAVMKLADQETAVGSAIAYITSGYVTVVIASDASLSCKGGASTPQANIVSLNFPDRVMNYGTMGLTDMAQKQVSLGFLVSLGKAVLPQKLTLHVKEMATESIALDIAAQSTAGTEYIKGSIKATLCHY